MQIDRLGPDGWARFRAIRLASLADAPGAFGARLEDWADAPEERWRSRLTLVPLTFVARIGTDDVGVASGQVHGEEWAELISMWVHPSARGTGLVAHLIDAVVAWADEQGRTTYLMVRSDNAGARRAYERAGFVDRGVPDGWPDDAPPERRMELARRGRQASEAGG